MKRLFIASFALLFLVLISCGQKQASKLEKGTPEYQLAEELAKKVPYLDPDKNNAIVTTKDFTLTAGDVIRKMKSNAGNRINQLKSVDATQLKSVIEQNAENFGEQRLLLEAAKKANVTLSQAEIDSVLNLQYARAGGEEKFVDWLTKNGFDIEYVKSDIANGLLVQKFLDQELGDQIKVTDEELQEAYKKDKTASVRHILLNTQGKSDSAKKEIYKKMEDILAQAKSGKDFASLAKKYSEDPGSKDNGGLYKDFPRGRMVKPFDDAAFSVPVGDISDIIETRFGYHILKVIDRKKETRPFEDVKEQLKRQLESQKRRDAYDAYIQKLKDESEFKLATM